MRIKCLAALIGLSVLLWGAGVGHAQEDLYYPLKQGMTWEYVSVPGGKAGKKIIITNLAPRQMDDKTIVPRKWDMGGAVKYVLVGRDEGGIYKYGEQKAENAAPVLTTPKEYYIKYPIAERSAWETVTNLGEARIKLTLTLESITEAVTVPAGTYKDCLKIKQAGTGPANGAELSITAYEWYAPQVGLIKSMASIKKKAKGQPESTDTYTFELQSFRP
jgi:hypothetical protein